MDILIQLSRDSSSTMPFRGKFPQPYHAAPHTLSSIWWFCIKCHFFFNCHFSRNMLTWISEATSVAVWRKEGCHCPGPSGGDIRVGDVMKILEKFPRGQTAGGCIRTCFDLLLGISGKKETGGFTLSSRGHRRKSTRVPLLISRLSSAGRKIPCQGED